VEDGKGERKRKKVGGGWRIEKEKGRRGWRAGEEEEVEEVAGGWRVEDGG